MTTPTTATVPTLADLLAGLHAELRGCTATTPVVQLAVDSRRVVPGGTFVAVAGGTSDGHDFLADALARGAALLVVQRGRVTAPSVPHVWLDDTRAALPRLAAAFYGWPGRALRLAGVTGTNGKTTTAHLVAACFAAAGHPHLRLGTTGNWLVDREETAAFTTPFPLELQALLRHALDRGATHGIMEVSSHALVQGRVAPLRFAAIGMTSFGQDHLDFHRDMDDYLAAKCLLAERHLDSAGVAVAAIDDHPACERFLAVAAATGARVWRASRGRRREAEIFVASSSPARDGTHARVITPGGELDLRSPLVGDFNLDNLLVAVGLALALDLPPSAIIAALAGCRGAPGRLERVDSATATPPGPAVYVDYAHTPDAVERAIAALRAGCRGELIVVLGCGGDRDVGKRPRMGAVAAVAADLLIATSDNPRSEDPERILDAMLATIPPGRRVVREVDRRRAIARAIASAGADDTVLIAGKGHEDYQIVGTDKLHLDDREEAGRALRAWRSIHPSR